MKKIIIFILFTLAAISLIAARPQPNLKKRLQETNAPTITPTVVSVNNVTVFTVPTATPPLWFTPDPNWRSPTPAGELYAVREGFPIGGYGPIYVTPAVRADDWQYPFYATPCMGWIDYRQVLYCVTATPAPLETATPPVSYP